MKPGTLLTVIGAVALIAILLYSFGGNSSAEYEARILQERADKDRYLQASDDSPFAGHDEAFSPLKYYPPDERFRIIATLRPVQERKVRVLATSDAGKARYLEYAWAEFDLADRKNRLLILEIMEEGPDRGSLFLAFGDQTSASETYGAGRYLDVSKVPGSTTVELDFNKAYNPYCAYNETYSCPLPPPENLLDVGIRAGEKTYK